MEKKSIDPKFKTGDTIVRKDCKDKIRVINFVLDNEYNLFGGGKIPFSEQDDWELVSNNFERIPAITANDLIRYFRKTPVNSLDILVVVDDKEIGDVQFVYDEKRKKYVFNLLLKV